MTIQAKRLAPRLVSVLAVLTLTTAAAGAAPAPKNPLATARMLVAATDHAPIVETRDSASVAGHAIYASYSDRRRQLAATYLEGKLVQGTVDTTLYAANGACFRREQLPKFVGLTRIATTLLPLPSREQRVSYALSGHTLHWREAATKQHSVERGTVEFDQHGRITSSRTAPYTYGHSRAAGQRLKLVYPAKLPHAVPSTPPKPACKASAEREQIQKQGGE